MENDDFSSIQAEEIVRQLELPTEDRRPLKFKLQREASVKALVKALQISKVDLTRRILCDILGARRAKSAIPIIIECLDSPSSRLKDDAAEALGRIGSIRAGEALLEHFENEPRLWLAVALGAVGYRRAIPALINALSHSSSGVRGGAAWSLGEMKVLEAENHLVNALEEEVDEYAKARMVEAVNLLKSSGR